MTAAIIETMSTDERVEFLKEDKVVRDHKDSFVKCGLALERIRDERLYRDSYKTFEDYCQNRLGNGRRYANYLIEGAVAVKELPKSLGTIVPNSGAALAVARVPRKRRAKVIKEVVESGQPVTARAITEAANSISPPLAVYRDEIGIPIPSKIQHLWDRRIEVREMMKSISEIKSAVSKGVKETDPLYLELTNTAIADINTAYQVLTYVLPYAVCPSCQGHLAASCTTCHGRGFVSKHRYLTVPSEIREMQENIGRKSGK